MTAGEHVYTGGRSAASKWKKVQKHEGSRNIISFGAIIQIKQEKRGPNENKQLLVFQSGWK